MGLINCFANHRRELVSEPKHLLVQVRPFRSHMPNQSLDHRNIWREQRKADGDHDQAEWKW